jgi:lipopolysaccharide O-acetyltransferase
MERNLGSTIKIYGFFGFLRLVRDKIFTIIFFPQARIVRLPVYIRNRQGIDGGYQLTTGINLRIDVIDNESTRPKLKLGKNVQLNDYVHIGVAEEVSIGDNTLIASKVFISDHNHGSYSGEIQSSPFQEPIERPLSSKKINIGSNVWIGEYVAILPGVTIGDGSIIGSMSVVTRDIPPLSIAVGSPAKVIKQFDTASEKWIAV